MLQEISVKKLTPGMYISLKNVPWFKHPFLRSSFLIKSSSEIKDIASLGRDTILYDPEKSEAEPLKKEREIKVEATETSHSDKSMAKTQKASELRKRRLKFQQVEKDFIEATTRSQKMMMGILNGSVQLCEESKDIAYGMAKTFLQEIELCVNHINISATDDGQHFHGLNVMVLSLMLGQKLGLQEEEMRNLAFGALMHDIGIRSLPKALCVKTKLSKLELEQFQQHPRLGVTILSKMPDIDRNVMKIVYQHHEECDGNGYPKRIASDEINSLTKIVAIADIYDRMINPVDSEMALSPHRALALMYSKYKTKLDEEKMCLFIKMLGVYPPGTVCRFTSGDIGIIMSVNGEDPLNPEVILYDPAIPKHDAIIYKLGVDLDIQVESTIAPTELNYEEFNYLNSRTKIQYFPASP